MLATAGILLVATLLPQLDPDLNIVMKDRTLDVALSALTMVARGGPRGALLHALPGDRPTGLLRAVLGVRSVGHVHGGHAAAHRLPPRRPPGHVARGLPSSCRRGSRGRARLGRRACSWSAASRPCWASTAARAGACARSSCPWPSSRLGDAPRRIRCATCCRRSSRTSGLQALLAEHQRLRAAAGLHRPGARHRSWRP